MTTYSPNAVTIFDVSDHSPLSLAKVATEVYGRDYKPDYGIYEVNNDSIYEFRFNNEDDVKRGLDSTWNQSTIAKWLAVDDTPPEDVTSYFQKPSFNATPDPSEVIADLISKGHLPYGIYQIHVSY